MRFPFLEKSYEQVVFPLMSLALLGGLMFVGSALSRQHYATFVTVLLSIIIEALPFLLAGSIFSGLIHVFVDQRMIFRVVPRHPFLGALFGAACGIVFPICECGVIPVVRRLYQKGLPLSIGVAFMLGAPVVNPIVIASTYAAFGWGPMLISRVGCSWLIASVIGWLFAFAAPQDILRGEKPPAHHEHIHDAAAHCACHAAPPSRTERFAEALAVAGDDFLDMSRYLIAGALIAAGLQTFVPQDAFFVLKTNPLTAAFTMQLLAFVLSVCSTADAFLALAFANTFTPAAVFAFLVFGPMVDIKTTLMLSRIFRRRSVVYLMLLTGTMTLAASMALNMLKGW